MEEHRNKFQRDISLNERLYLNLQKLYTTFSIQFIIEGKGKIGKAEFKRAVEEFNLKGEEK